MNWGLTNALLALAVIGTAVAVVSVKHESRKLFVELHGLEQARDQLDVEWGKLQLEQSTWASHGRIEHVARKQLRMVSPRFEEVVVIRYGN